MTSSLFTYLNNCKSREIEDFICNESINSLTQYSNQLIMSRTNPPDNHNLDSLSIYDLQPEDINGAQKKLSNIFHLKLRESAITKIPECFRSILE